jgi:hypothetical protein
MVNSMPPYDHDLTVQKKINKYIDLVNLSGRKPSRALWNTLDQVKPILLKFQRNLFFSEIVSPGTLATSLLPARSGNSALKY